MNNFRRIITAATAPVALLIATGAASAQAPQPLAVGAQAPAFSVPDQNSRSHTLAKDHGHVVLLAFYPADMTSGCTIEAHSLSASYKDLKALGVRVYGVSVQDPGSHQRFCSKEGIPYTLLADTTHAMCQAYGVLSPQREVANRVTYIVDKNGEIAYVDTQVNSHLATCGQDWVTWLKAHPDILRGQKHVSELVHRSLVRFDSVCVAPTAKLGAPAPGFALTDVRSKARVTLAQEIKGKRAAVVIFIATRCPVSNAYNDRMVALANAYAKRGVAFVGINANQTEPVAECASHAADHHFPFPVLKDPTDAVADSYDARCTPEAYVIDAKGILVYHGRIDNNMDSSAVKSHDLAAALDQVLSGSPVTVSETKAFGCSIKRALND
jgi:peroxiredoxin